MKILYTPLMIVPSLGPDDRAQILDAAGPEPARRGPRSRPAEGGDRRHRRALRPRQAEVLSQARRLRYYQSIGAGVDAILTPEPGRERHRPGQQKRGGGGHHLAEHAFASC